MSTASDVKRSFLATLFGWLDEHILFLLAGFLIAFVPLWPKIPLFSPIEQYIVRVRMEDIVIFLAGVLWLIQWLRGKITWKYPIVLSICAYALAGFLSVLSALFVINTVPLEPLHVGKTLLHYFRYLEYFALFFITFSAVKTKKQVWILVAILCVTVIAVSIYGFGQKYYYWPVYSTMNREFSKGVRLYLTEHARVQSTFAGHYDLGAYMVLILPIILALGFVTQKTWLKLALWTSHWIGLWLLVVSAARTSFIAYVFGVGLVLLILGFRQASWAQRFWWWLSRSSLVMALIVVTFLQFGQDVYERFLQLLAAFPETNTRYHELNKQRKENTEFFLIGIGWQNIAMPSLPSAKKPENAVAVGEINETGSAPVAPIDTTGKPLDVFVDVPDYTKVASTSADGTITTTLVPKPREYSDNAIKYGLSIGIRLDTLWPQALAGFRMNPLLGKGYATLNKQGTYQFTEADSTDNNFLRTLGETGLLGFITFYGTIVLACYFALRALRSQDAILVGLATGYFGGTIGLLLNAVYIDVFAASKVALSYWCMTGLFMGYYVLTMHSPELPIFAGKTAPQLNKQSDTAIITPKKRAKKKL